MRFCFPILLFLAGCCAPRQPATDTYNAGFSDGAYYGSVAVLNGKDNTVDAINEAYRLRRQAWK